MAYTEIKERNGKKYYYRARSIRHRGKFSKKRVYLGKNLAREKLFLKEKEADEKLNVKKGSKRLEKIIPEIRRILKKNKVKRAGIFGSYAKGEEKKGSDIDILVEPPKGMGFGFVGIQLELQEKLKKKVDLLTYSSINHLLKKRILGEEIRII